MQATESPDRVVYWGTGRRKSSIARVRLVPGNGQIIVNNKPGEEYFNRIPGHLQGIKAPLETLGFELYNTFCNMEARVTSRGAWYANTSKAVDYTRSKMPRASRNPYTWSIRPSAIATCLPRL